MKDYKSLQAKERTAWLDRFGKFIAEDYANVKAMGNGWREGFKRGLSLLESFSVSERFVRDARQFMDFERRVKRLCFLIEELRRQVIEAEGDVLARVAGPQYKRGRGRPTAETLAVERKALAQQEADAKVAEALAVVSGQEVEFAKSKPLPESKVEQKVKMQGPDLFAMASEAESGNDEPAEFRDHEGGTSTPTLHLQDVKHLLSAELAERVENVAMLRGRAATESEMAKSLAMGGGSKEEVAAHAEEAAKCVKAYTDVYDAVDKELAMLYVRTRLEAEAVVEGESRESQLNKCKAYFDKAVAADPTFEGKALMQLQKKNEAGVLSPDGVPMSKADKAALLHKYRSFFFRKGVKVTKDRVKKMEEIIAYLKSINEPCEEYEHILEESKKKASPPALPSREGAKGNPSREGAKGNDNSLRNQ